MLLYQNAYHKHFDRGADGPMAFRTPFIGFHRVTTLSISNLSPGPPRERERERERKRERESERERERERKREREREREIKIWFLIY